jgi:hypothetical protein
MNRAPRFCKWDMKPIPEDVRFDALYCSPKCGWKYRNERNRRKKPVIEKTDDRRETNIRIIKDLMSREIYEIPMKSLEDNGFDFDCYDRFGEVDQEKRTAEFIISTVSFTIIDENVKFKNLNDGRT